MIKCSLDQSCQQAIFNCEFHCIKYELWSSRARQYTSGRVGKKTEEYRGSTGSDTIATCRASNTTPLLLRWVEDFGGKSYFGSLSL